jgi:hypothetical protein
MRDDAPVNIDVTLITFLDAELFRDALAARKGPLHYEGRDDEWLYVSAPGTEPSTVLRVGCDVMNDGELLSFGRDIGSLVVQPSDRLAPWRARVALDREPPCKDGWSRPRFHFIGFGNARDLLATLRHSALRPRYLGCDERHFYVTLTGIRHMVNATHALLLIERNAIDPRTLRTVVQELADAYDIAFEREWDGGQPPWGTYAPAFRRWRKDNRLNPEWPCTGASARLSDIR